MDKLVSIVIPTKNNGDILEKCLASKFRSEIWFSSSPKTMYI